MSRRGRAERSFRWGHNQARSPVWEDRRSASAERTSQSSSRDQRDRDRRERHDRYDRDGDRERDRDGEHHCRRDRCYITHELESDRRRSPRRFDDKDIPAPPSPPQISGDFDRNCDSQSSSRSGSRERQESNTDSFASKYDREKHDDNQTVNGSPGDWLCKCGFYNIKLRPICYRLNCQGKRIDGTVYGGDIERVTTDFNSGITKNLLFSRFDALATDKKILEAIKERCSKAVLDSIAIYENVQALLSTFQDPPKKTADTLAPELAYAHQCTSKPKSDQQSSNNNDNENNAFQNKRKSYPNNKTNKNKTFRKPLFCPRCRINTHNLRQCQADKSKIICFVCGHEGVKTPQCPDCYKNKLIKEKIVDLQTCNTNHSCDINQ